MEAVDGEGRTEFIAEDEVQQGAGTATALADRITTKFMTKYERARILGVRALQIAYVLIRFPAFPQLSSFQNGCAGDG